ncbi:hypothetical protein A1O3_03496 [Capronia epimyces CBS 606.96]|uniref:CRIB domain-containing protein n=1 Tax=Capronia epimyces CBS 606.96 TaxID=1182542 RepID=W9Y226_9EURO|nr:uncharacterized protein A1O3_03496 [Capronia epimyces CBS 606.96]EXJ86543.1 hypothetical protein A1O3_03496 [Capronia epimyces CBS 606.96]
MGRFPWGQGQPKHSSDKLHAITHDWFSKDNAEPSRQALNDMKREQSFGSGTSDGSPRYQGRSRANTTSSSISFYARSGSDASNDLTSRPSSRQSFVDSSQPFGERHDNSAKSLLSRGSRILKRQTSKLSLLPSSTEEKTIVRVEGKVGQGSPVKGLQRQLTFSSQRDDLRRNISTPFAFQHLSHGDQAHFQSLDNVTRTRLTSEFNAIQADQRPDDRIRGIPVTDLPTQGTESEVRIGSEPTSPTTSAIPYLPTTPPRPQPPPKDPLVSPCSPSDIRLSRSMENFSRPTRLSMAASDLPSPFASSSRLSAMSPVCRNSFSAKPLPQVPTVVHAVSTTDDVALPLRTAPLPSPPNTIMEVVEEECTEQINAQISDTPPSRGLQLAEPISPIQRRRRSQSSGEIDFDMSYYSMAPIITSPEGSTATKNHDCKPKHRISIGVKTIQLEDWEDAIDYSWDHAAELEEVENRGAPTTDRSRPPSIQHESFLHVEQGAADETSSAASTPLMMQGAREGFEMHQMEQKPIPSRRLDEEPSSPLLGLGIDSVQSVPTDTVAQSDAAHIEPGGNRFESTEIYRPNFIRSPNSCMSKSSSQESIILSIASSIIGTHRSSNSSTSLSDFTHLANFGGSLDNLKLDFEGTSFPVEMRARDGSQDTIREESQGPSATATEDLDTRFDSPVAFKTSPNLKHDRGKSASQIPIPERKSSMPGSDISHTHTGRRRAGTTNSRPRGNTRVSYSLFPNT